MSTPPAQPTQPSQPSQPAQPPEAEAPPSSPAPVSSTKAKILPTKVEAARPAAQKAPSQGTLRQLEFVIGIAVVLATLFTAWTPGRTTPELPAQGTIVAVVRPTSPAPGSPTDTPRARPLVAIVAGHWKFDSGAVCGDGTKEVDVNLNIATLAQKLLVAQGYDVDLLGEYDSRLSGYKASALVSVHNDSCDYINDQATGYKVASAMASKYPDQAARLTACLRSRYGQITGLTLHSSSVTPDMANYHTFEEINENTPAAIIETGFLNLDRQFLIQKPDVAAEGIVSGILCFLRNESILPPTLIPAP